MQRTSSSTEFMKILILHINLKKFLLELCLQSSFSLTAISMDKKTELCFRGNIMTIGICHMMKCLEIYYCEDNVM